MIRAAVVALAALAAAPAVAQTSAASGPIVRLDTYPGSFMVMGSNLPTRRPDAPVEVWIWLFANATQTRPNGAVQATRTRVDCATRSTAELRRETYDGSTFERGRDLPGDVNPAGGSSSRDAIVDHVCGYAANPSGYPRRYGSVAEARAAADAWFAGQ